MTAMSLLGLIATLGKRHSTVGYSALFNGETKDILNVAFYCYYECCYAECHLLKCLGAQMSYFTVCNNC